MHREDIARFYGENSVMHMFMYTAAISGMIVGKILQQIDWTRMNQLLIAYYLHFQEYLCAIL